MSSEAEAKEIVSDFVELLQCQLSELENRGCETMTTEQINDFIVDVYRRRFEKKKIIKKIIDEEEDYEPYDPIDEEDLEEMEKEDHYYDYDKKCYMIRKKPNLFLWDCNSEVEVGQRWYFKEGKNIMIEIDEKEFEELINDKKYRVFDNSSGIGGFEDYCERNNIKILWKKEK